MVKDHLLEKFSENDLQSQSYRIYTTLDPSLQRAATAAVHSGMEQVDKLLAKRYAIWKKAGQPVPRPQVALVALDPRTGEIRALVGGRSYGESQLNHALAHRQPGSVFKPFVYAAAFDNAVKDLQPIVTPVTMVDDVPTTFQFDGKDYTPDNFGQEFYGTVTVRDALIHSLNVATIKVAEMIGYRRVVELSRQVGLGNNIMATPASPRELQLKAAHFGVHFVHLPPACPRYSADHLPLSLACLMAQIRVFAPRFEYLLIVH